MTDGRDREPFEVPIARLTNGRRDGRRAAIAALSIVAVLAGAVGLARWTPDDAATSRPSRSPRVVADASGATTGSPGASAAPRGSIGPRVERLIDVPDRALDGGPTIDLVESAGRDLRVVRWTPGAGVAPFRTFADALVGPNDSSPTWTFTLVPVLSPAGERVVLLGGGTESGTERVVHSARITDTSGTVLWAGDDVATGSGAVWSSDADLAVIAGNERDWHLVEFRLGGRVVDRLVELPGEIFLPSPIPIGSITIPRIAPRTVPLGFSADGRWIYGGIVSAELGILIGTFRVAVDGDRVERVNDLGVGRRDGLVPSPGTVGGRLVDPVLGRIANWRVGQVGAGGPPTVEVRNRDAGFAFTVEAAADAAIPLGSGWDADGSLIILAADSVLFPNRVRLERIDRNATTAVPILETGPLTSASLLGVRDGFAALALWTTKPDIAAQVVVVDLAHPGVVTGVALPADGTATVMAAELRP